MDSYRNYKPARFVFVESNEDGEVFNTRNINSVQVFYDGKEDIQRGVVNWKNGDHQPIGADTADMLTIELMGRRP